MEYTRWAHPWMQDLHRPIYIMNSPARIEDADLQSLLESNSTFCTTVNHPYALVCVTDSVLAFSAKQRAMMAEYEKMMRPYEAKWNKGQAWVMPSALQRTALRAIYWLSAPVYPYTIVKTRAEGLAWATQQLRDCGINVISSVANAS